MDHIARQRATLGAVLGLLTLLGTEGCRNRSTESVDAKPAELPQQQAAPWIKAEPNPVSISAGEKQGTTTISWDAGNGSDAQVYLRVPGKPDQIFSGGSRNHQDAAWIRKGVNYEFILFAGKEQQKELARITVTAAP